MLHYDTNLTRSREIWDPFFSQTLRGVIDFEERAQTYKYSKEQNRHKQKFKTIQSWQSNNRTDMEKHGCPLSSVVSPKMANGKPWNWPLSQELPQPLLDIWECGKNQDKRSRNLTKPDQRSGPYEMWLSNQDNQTEETEKKLVLFIEQL